MIHFYSHIIPVFKLRHDFLLGLSFYGYGCCKSDFLTSYEQNVISLAECKMKCLDEPECISIETRGSESENDFKCLMQKGRSDNFGVGCDLNLDTSSRKCYKRDPSSNEVILNFP